MEENKEVNNVEERGDEVVKEIFVMDEEKTEKEETKKENHNENNHNNKSHDANNDKVWYALAYLIFFLPLITIPNSTKGKFHANQGLTLLIVAIVGQIVLGLIPFIGWMLSPLYSLATFVLLVVGFVNGLNEKQKPLPIIGKWLHLIK